MLPWLILFFWRERCVPFWSCFIWFLTEVALFCLFICSGRGWNEGGGAPPWWEDLPEWIAVKELNVCDYIARVAAESADFILSESKERAEERREGPGGGDWNGQSVSNMLNGIARCWEVGWVSRPALEEAFSAMSRSERNHLHRVRASIADPVGHSCLGLRAHGRALALIRGWMLLHFVLFAGVFAM